MNSFAFSYRERHTKKKGLVYDVVFRIPDADGKLRQKVLCGFPSKKLAKQAYSDFMSSYVPPKRNKPQNQALTYELARDNYYAALESTVKESSLYTVFHTFRSNIDPYFKGRLMNSIKQEDIYAWQDIQWSRRKSNGELYSQTRLVRVKNFFKSFVKWCVKRYGINNFFDGVDTPVRRSQKREYVIWTKEMFNRFYFTIDNPRLKAMFYTLFYSGIRCGELQALTPDDFNGKELIIKATYTKKTMDGSQYKITETKNYKPHAVPLPPHAQKVLNDWLEFKKSNNLDNTFLFGGEHPIPQCTIQNAMAKHTKLADLPAMRIHDFRHSYVSMLISNGANFAVIAALIGDTIEQVVKTYSHLTHEDLTTAVNNL